MLALYVRVIEKLELKKDNSLDNFNKNMSFMR